MTPIERFGDIWVKREDLACWSSLTYPSGSKVRQYQNMAKATPGLPMIVGCAGTSAMQIYVAAAAKEAAVPAYVYTAANKIRSSATEYAERMGAVTCEIRPGYMNVIRAKAKEHAHELGSTVRWDPKRAVIDAWNESISIQPGLLPDGVKRVVIPTGSGLTAVGILCGLSCVDDGPHPDILLVSVSGLANVDDIKEKALKYLGYPADVVKFPKIEIIRHPKKYNQHEARRLPDGTPLDPYYAAKAWPYVQPGDLFWPPGLRPVCSMPRECQNEFGDWKGPDTAREVRRREEGLEGPDGEA